MSIILFIQLLCMGLGGGFLAGLLGVGGGMVLVPFLTAMFSVQGFAPELVVKMAIATAMATIMFTSISSARAHHLKGAVQWQLVKAIAPGIVLGASIASWGIFSFVKGQALALFFAVFVGINATQMLRNRPPKPSGQMPPKWGQAAMGVVIGLISGLVGAGGGFISVPWMTRCNVPMHKAIATSAALGFPIAVFNVMGFVLAGWSVPNLPQGCAGYIYLPALLVIASASVCMAPLGAKAAHILPVKTLKRVFALLLYALAAYMLQKALSSTP
jgi:uncharacterized protein